MLGFATVDLSLRDHRLTVWLTSVGTNTEVAHTNALSFDLAEDSVSHRAWSMTCDRYVILTDRTSLEHAVLAQWGVEPCSLAMLAKLTTTAEEAVMVAFAEETSRPGKADLMEPILPPVPGPLDQAALEACSPQQLTLAVANQVNRIWVAWLVTERERPKRWTYLPRGRKGETLNPLPAEFVRKYAVQPIRA